MPLSFSLDPVDSPLDLARPPGERPRVLVTGAAGRIGSSFAEYAREAYALRLMVQGDEDPAKIDAIRPFGEVAPAQLADLEKLRALCEGVDAVVHLAGNPDANATWDSIRRDNVEGTYNLFVAAKAAGVRRVVYASSIHAISGYPKDVQVKSGDPVNPGDLYGVSKCFGEALARYMAEQEGVSAICLRIGAFQPIRHAEQAKSVYMMDAFVSERDLNQLICRCVDDRAIRFAVFAGLSDNAFKRMDLTDARELVGYAPQDDLAALNPELRPLDLRRRVIPHSRPSDEKSGLRGELEALGESSETRNEER